MSAQTFREMMWCGRKFARFCCAPVTRAAQWGAGENKKIFA
jgi:hypothetical protein